MVQLEDLRQRDIPIVDARCAQDVATQGREGPERRSGEDGRVEPTVGRAVAEREERTTASGGTLARGTPDAGDVATQLRIQRKSALEGADAGQLPSAQNLARHTGAALQPGQLIRVADDEIVRGIEIGSAALARRVLRIGHEAVNAAGKVR